MKKFATVLVFLTAVSLFWGSAQTDTSHPRLFLRSGEDKILLENISRDTTWSRMHRAIVAECDTICLEEPMERILEGPRLHAVSCEVLRRVLFLSYAYRTTGDVRYAERAEREMLHICDFTDWNPSHFLDVAEMSTALGIGYDWLYGWLSDESKARIVEAIITKGLDPSEDARYNPVFTTRPSRTCNWGQVCNGGLAVASIAIHTENPEQASRIIERSRELMMLPMNAEYPPEGCYPEGFGYWAFGTQYNILFISAMEKYFGAQSVSQYKVVPGFIESGNYSQQLITPSLRTFGYSDNSTRIYLEPAVMWFNTVKEDPKMYFMQKRLFDKFDLTHSYVKTIKNRLIPMMLVWGVGTGDAPLVSLDRAEEPRDLFYLGQGENDVCVMRNSWRPDAAYLGFKSGRVNNPHGHMDIGSFYYETDGVRWSLDLGSDHYGDIAKAHINMFNMKQDSPRWTVLTKYNNFAHSTTGPEGVYQIVDAQCHIDSIACKRRFKSVSSDLTGVYAGKLEKLVRTVSLRGRCAEITDIAHGTDEILPMNWTMITEAVSMQRRGASLVLRSQDGRTLKMRVKCSSEFECSLEPMRQRCDFENPSDGIFRLTIKYNVAPGKDSRIRVRLKP